MQGYCHLGGNMIRNAEVFATAAHAATGQRRKYTDEPYIVHPQAVARLVQSCPSHVWQQVVLAWLHDTVEDTKVTLEVIRDMFGDEIAGGLHFLTNVNKSSGNRALRHQINVQRLSNAPGWVQTVKIADIFDNTKRIVELDPVFAPQYLKEKVHTMLSLKKGDRELWQETFDQIHRLERELLVTP